MASYGSYEEQFSLEYPNVNNENASHNNKFYTVTTTKQDSNGKSYSITSVYEDPEWYQDFHAVGGHRFVGTVDSRYPDQFVTNQDDAVNALANGTGDNKGATKSQEAYFSSPEGLAVIHNKGRLSTLNALRDQYKKDDPSLSDLEAERKAMAALNDIIPNNSMVSPESSVNNNGFSLKPRVIATQRDEMAGKPGTHLVYPQDHAQGDFDFIKIVPIEYVPQLSSRGWDTLTSVKQRYKQRERVVGATMFLPMVPGINESNQVDWGGESLNPIQMAAANIAMRAIGEGKGTIGERVASLTQDVTGTANELFKNNDIRGFLTAYFAGQAVGANVLGRAGIVVNPNLEVLFKGPKLRTFNYNFKFTPRDDREAKTIRTIIKVVKKAMAPKRRKAAIFLNVPAVFKIKYLMRGTTEHPFLNKIKPCAMVGFNVDYTPDGSYMTYGDGSMTSYKVSMNLAEIEPIYNDDIELDSQNMGY